jgi:hypothetical protein
MSYGDHYVVGGAGDGERVPILSLLDPLPRDVIPVLRHGPSSQNPPCGGNSQDRLRCAARRYAARPLAWP